MKAGEKKPEFHAKATELAEQIVSAIDGQEVAAFYGLKRDKAADTTDKEKKDMKTQKAALIRAFTVQGMCLPVVCLCW